jgi:predicted transcriptional regulator
MLADRAVVSVNALARLEKGQVDSRVSTIQAVQGALIRGGIDFIEASDRGEGVRLSSPNL